MNNSVTLWLGFVEGWRTNRRAKGPLRLLLETIFGDLVTTCSLLAALGLQQAELGRFGMLTTGRWHR
jgi:hypothetical protein